MQSLFDLVEHQRQTKPHLCDLSLDISPAPAAIEAVQLQGSKVVSHGSQRGWSLGEEINEVVLEFDDCVIGFAPLQDYRMVKTKLNLDARDYRTVLKFREESMKK